ncbi:hypothetical protein PQI23_11695 [Leucobacter sp. USCH14]|uniref:hypothetical protein n=1 Tax=Leucobacter sp. USCH14 TaxID=3024838 RepID=UPI0030AA5BB1
MILTAIVICEVAFWVAILAGLSARYLLNRKRLGALLLILAPVIDALLLALVTIDLLGGGTASWQHGLAAIYIGISVAYGSRMVAWADARFAHRFAGGPAPVKMTGVRYTVKCWKDVLVTACAVAIAAAILGAIIALVDDPARTEALTGFFGILGVVLAIDVVWALSYTFWPKPAPAQGSSLPS